MIPIKNNSANIHKMIISILFVIEVDPLIDVCNDETLSVEKYERSRLIFN